MRIFNNFDTELKSKEYKEAVNTHWKENVILVERYISYWIFKWILPIIRFSIWMSIYSYWVFNSFSMSTTFGWILLSIGVIGCMFFLYYLLNTYIEYKMDFTIITKDWINTYKQMWIFNSQFKNLPSSKIRSIQASRQGIFGNIFWYWYVEFLTDGSLSSLDKTWRHQAWKTKLKHVSKPNELRKRVNNLCIWVDKNWKWD